LLSGSEIPEKWLFAESLIKQFHLNRGFSEQAEVRALLLAGVSAGKSTLINALIGKRVARMAQEACTANLCYLFKESFEDEALHVLASPLNLNASGLDLMRQEKSMPSYVATYFRVLVEPKTRVCLIDTPGANFSLRAAHGKLTQMPLIDDEYHKVIYVLNANKLGTQEEIKRLKRVSENVAKEKNGLCPEQA